jgi:hypothetical protein
MVRVLLQHGADPNMVRNDQFTALMLAAFFGHQDIVRILVEHGANTDATARFGTSAQMWAASRTFKDVVRYLEHPGSTHESSKVATVANNCAKLPLEATSLKGAENESSLIPTIPVESLVRNADCIPGLHKAPVASAVQNSNELRQVAESFKDLVPRSWFRTRLQPLNRSIRVYAWTILLLTIAVFAHLGLDRNQRVAKLTSQSDPPVVIDKNAVAVSPSKDSFSNSIEEKAAAPSGAQPDKLVSNNDTTSNSKKASTSKPPITTSRVVPVGDSDSRVALKKPTTTSVRQSLPTPEPTPDLARGIQFTSARSSTPKPQSTVSREPATKRDPAPLPTQLINGSKGAARDGKVIQWP